jgi:integrase
MARKQKLPDGMYQRGRAYYADFYAGGRRVRKRLSSNLDAARQILNDMRARADKADFGLLDNNFAVADLQEHFLKDCRQALRASSADRYAVCLANILPRLSASRVAQFAVARVLTYREERLQAGISPCTVNKDVGALLTMLRWGVRHNFIGSNPLAGLTPLPHDDPKEGRPLSDDEVSRLLERSPRLWRDIWYTFLVTGMRKDELASLRFRDIDWEAREIVVRSGAAKNHRERRIPIDTGLWEILKRQEAGRDERQPGKGRTERITLLVRARFTKEHVFVTSQNTPLSHRSAIYGAFMRWCKRAGVQTETLDAEGRQVEHVDVHSLRRTFATNLITGGADPKSVQELLGHRTLDMTMRIYAKVNMQSKRQALGRLSYGKGTLAPAGLLEYPGKEGFSVPFGHRSVTSPKTDTDQMTQTLAAQ